MNALPSARQIAPLLLFPVVAVSGCAALGYRVNLAKAPVTSVSLSLAKGPGIAPGQKTQLVATFTQPGGKTLRSVGAPGGSVSWKDLFVTSDVVKVSPRGVVSLRHDPRPTEGKTGHVTVAVPSHPGLRAELDVPFRYDVAFLCNFSGQSGADGNNGSDGMSGTPGTMGSIDPNSPSPGGDGGNGTDGANGGDGASGGDAAAVEVFLTLHPVVLASSSAAPQSRAPGAASAPAENPLVEAKVVAAGKTRYYLIDPAGGSLTVHADGGSGGSGGRGGRGGSGGLGGTGIPNGNNGRSGSDGRNGLEGSPGRGGAITVICDPQAAPYLRLLHLSSQYGPVPLIRQRSVPPLW